MENQPLVVLFGNSLLMDSVADCLASRLPVLRLIRLDTAAADIREQAHSIEPDMIVFELDTPWSDTVLSLLRERPGTLLLGIDLTCNRVILLNSCQRITQSMQDLSQVVQTEVSRKTNSATRR